MRLAIMNEGLSFLQRLQVGLLRRIIGHVPGPIVVQSYRPDYFGRPFNDCVVDALRRTTFWTKAEAELLAGFVSSQNQCTYCMGAHTAIAARGFTPEVVEATIRDWKTSSMSEPMRATLGFLQKLTQTPESVSADDIATLREASVPEEGIREAVYICFVFCTINRIADAFEFDVPTSASYQRLGFTLYKMGYGLAVLPG